MINRLAARDWLATHLAALVWCAMVLWVPPVAFAIGVDLGWLQPPGSGYPALTDPSLLLATLQLTLMVAALPGMTARQQPSWQLLLGALLVWCAHAAWGIVARVRLNGGGALLSSETPFALIGPALAAAMMLIVRPAFTAGRALATRRPTRSRPPAGLQPGMKLAPASRCRTPGSRAG
jgi:hypothetical protein